MTSDLSDSEVNARVQSELVARGGKNEKLIK
jgi:hypothetical protein